MKEMVAYCGITCSECLTYLATQNNDDDARIKIAETWSKQYRHNFKPEDINCDGCLSVGKRQIGYCTICEIRKCGLDKHILNCGYCRDYPCDKLNDFQAPQAKAKLEAIRNAK